MSSAGNPVGRVDTSPTKQRTPRQLPHQKNIGIFFAQSNNTIDMSSVMPDTSGSEDDEESGISECAENGSSKKRKQKDGDALMKKLNKIRKTFDSNIKFANDNDDSPPDSETCATDVLDEAALNSAPTDSLSSNIELTIKDKSTINGASNQNGTDSQATECLEGLDDFFEEDWSHKTETVSEYNDFFEDDWTYNEPMNFVSPKRCIVIDARKEGSDLVLTVSDPTSESKAEIKCSGTWLYTKIELGEPIVVVAKKDTPQEKFWTVDNNHGWIISQPDTLISGTSVVGALFCNRRSIFQEKFRQMDSLPYNKVGNQYMLTGSLSHELLQTTLDLGLTDLKQISTLLDDILKSKHAIQMMYSGGVSLTECRTMMKSTAAQTYQFIQRYIKGIQPNVADDNYKGKIEKICDIEENVWLPSLGLKGKIDLTVEVSDDPKNQLFSSRERRMLPLELKTGRSSFSSEHQGQLILYTMMMSMSGRKANSGLLLYLKENIMKEIVGSSHAQRDLITLRNTVAYYSTRKPTVLESEKISDEANILPTELPRPINHPGCTRCSCKVLCAAYLTDKERELLQESHHFKKVSEQAISHLSTDHLNYVKKWISMLQLEENRENQDSSSFKDLWTIDPPTREKKGSCISNLTVASVTQKNGRYLHEFHRLNVDEESSEIDPTNFSVQEYIIISTNDRINVCTGYIESILPTSVSVHCIKDITKVYSNQKFHIDKSSSYSFLVQNMSQVAGLLDDNEICSRLRRIVIDKEPATFNTEFPESFLKANADILDKLNEDQKQAIIKTMTADDYVLIKGYPGTGKTQTLVAMIEILVRMKKSVLVTAHTNTAVDNILLKLLERKIDFIRFGTSPRTHPSLHHTLDDVLTADCDSPESLHAVYSSKAVIGVTCYGATHPHFSKRMFDVCIIDESTQVLQPTILLPLYCASKFVLVGDPEQLPPIAKSNIARKLGINESLFSRLDSDNNSVSLTLQYRMNHCIMNVANKLTYHDQLKVGNETVGNATLAVTDIKDFESCEKWIRKTLSMRLKNSAIMLNTSATHHLVADSLLGNVKQRGANYWEVAMIVRLIQVLKNIGIDATTIGVISPYRAQVYLLKKVCPSDIEVNTVDQYQGRDKSVIIYSCTKSLPPDVKIHEFDILEDQQRLTVAVTRAKHKLIVIGDLSTLQRFTPFNKLIGAFREQNQIYDLKDGEDDFSFEDLIRLLV